LSAGHVDRIGIVGLGVIGVHQLECGSVNILVQSSSPASAALDASSQARGESAIDRDPALNDAPVEVPASAKGKGGSRFRATVDVFFHVVSDGTNGNLSDSAITDRTTAVIHRHPAYLVS
jgi:hypothetical protein